MWGNPKRKSNTTTEQNPIGNEAQNYTEGVGKERTNINNFGKQCRDWIP